MSKHGPDTELTATEAEQLIREALPAYRAVLNLFDWDISVEFVMLERNERGKNHAACQVLPEYKRANIAIDRSHCKTRAGILDSFRHEMFHVTQYMYVLAFDVIEAMVPASHHDAFGKLCNQTIELDAAARSRVFDDRGLTCEEMLSRGKAILARIGHTTKAGKGQRCVKKRSVRSPRRPSVVKAQARSGKDHRQA